MGKNLSGRGKAYRAGVFKEQPAGLEAGAE